MSLAFGDGGGTSVAKYLLGESPTEPSQGALALARSASMFQRAPKLAMYATTRSMSSSPSTWNAVMNNARVTLLARRLPARGEECAASTRSGS